MALQFDLPPEGEAAAAQRLAQQGIRLRPSGLPSFMNIPDRTPEQLANAASTRFGTVFGAPPMNPDAPPAFLGDLSNYRAGANEAMMRLMGLREAQAAETAREAASRPHQLQLANIQAGAQARLSAPDAANLYATIEERIRGRPGNQNMTAAALHNATMAEMARMTNAASPPLPATSQTPIAQPQAVSHPPVSPAATLPSQSWPGTPPIQSPINWAAEVSSAEGETPQARLAFMLRNRQGVNLDTEWPQIEAALRGHFTNDIYNRNAVWPRLEVTPWPIRGLLPVSEEESALRIMRNRSSPRSPSVPMQQQAAPAGSWGAASWIPPFLRFGS